MACAPAAREAVLNVALVTPPDVLTLTGPPNGLPSIWNCTFPVGVPAPGLCTVMVAVTVTACPNSGGVTEELTAVVVVAWLTAWPPGREALLLVKLPSPL